MFTNNWDKVIGTVMSRVSTEYKNMSGTNKTANANYCTNTVQVGADSSYAQNASIWYLRNSLSAQGGVILGTGTTEPSQDDYCLSGDLISTFTYSKSVTVTNTDEGATLTAVFSITNTGESAFTIGEIGLIANLNGSNTGAEYKALLERTVLDSPVTIPAGGVGQVTYTIRMNYPT